MGSLFFKKGTDQLNTSNIKKFQDIKLIDIDGNHKTIGDYLINKKILIIVNVASECGYTSMNYKQLVDIYNKFSGRGLQILAFPCNQFKSQEPGSEPEIKKCMREKFKVEFPLFSKIEVNGENTHELYKYLKTNCNEFKIDDKTFKHIPWNFGKFLVDNNGKVLGFYSPSYEPIKLEEEINKYL